MLDSGSHSKYANSFLVRLSSVLTGTNGVADSFSCLN